MLLLERLKRLYRGLRRLEKAFLVVLLLYVLWGAWRPGAANPLAILLYLVGAWLSVRLANLALRKALWRLRNRLVICYVLIGVVPVVLILALAGIGMWLLTGQTAVYLVTAKLEDRTRSLLGPAQGLLLLPPADRAERIRWIAPYFRERAPGLEFLVQDRGEIRYPPDASLRAPPPGWGETSGLVVRRGRLYAWAHSSRGAAEVTFMAPVNREVLSSLVPNLGEVSVFIPRVEAGASGQKGAAPAKSRSRLTVIGQEVVPPLEDAEPGQKDHLPPPAGRLDLAVSWGSVLPMADWEKPGKSVKGMLLVRSRPSAVLGLLFEQKAEFSQIAEFLFVAVAVAFLVVELISLVIGASLTRTVTGAVHNLYEGTRKVMEGDFSHRIEVRGNDQLADLGHSFNRMTENLERLLAVAKEKERLQSELEIAREVQNQLFPKTVPALRSFQVLARCNPARTVSGDYYDYQTLEDGRLALAFGDVAGKGISAALLMATVQSAFRTQIRTYMEAAVSAGDGPGAASLSTSRLVAQLNHQLHAHSSPEKFATFYFGVYDDRDGTLTYTNAGHLPPILIRRGEVQRLEINGMVVGAFPFAEYGETRIVLECGDLLTCFTDGITEPENEYGEMYGEDRLIEVLLKNLQRDNAEIVDAVMNSVREWTGSPELQDDMTLLVARRI